MTPQDPAPNNDDDTITIVAPVMKVTILGSPYYMRYYYH